MANTSNSTILDLFQDYKNFYLSQLANESLDRETKISFMGEVIQNLMEQNELLLEVLLDVEQTTKDRSMQLHTLLKKMANKTCKVGLVLQSLELEAKKFANQSIPSFVECGNWIEQINSHVEHLEQENEELKKQNESFFQNIQIQNAELMQYKNMVFSLMSGRKKIQQYDSTATISQKIDGNYLELVLNNALTDINENVDTVVCANVLDELVSLVELNIENENNPICIENCSLQNHNQNVANKNDNLCDINDNYELDESTSDNSFIECLSQDCTYLEYDLKCFRPQMLSLLSTLCGELAFKTPVIFDLKRQLSHIKNEHLTLHNRHFQMAIQVLSTFVHLKDQLESQLESSQVKQKLLDKLDTEMSQMLCSESTIFPLLVNEISSDHH